MSIKKEQAIKDVKTGFENFSNLILLQLKLLQNIVNSRSHEIPDNLYKQIKKNEREIDKFEVKVSEDVINTIVLYNPVASELRQLMACYRMSVNLERIGDLVLNIVKFMRKIEDNKLYGDFVDAIDNILLSTLSMVEKSLLSFANEDIETAIWTIKNEEIVDDLHHAFIKNVIKKTYPTEKSQAKLSTFLYMKSIVSNIERIADNATDIAEATIYSLEGKDVRHKSIKSIDKEMKP
ncbi:MAG: phosphate uptake regulator PhoU [Bacteroidales bacterium]|nr:phosphate uptake regulator PhoU [Bacteroidales bacterium]